VISKSLAACEAAAGFEPAPHITGWSVDTRTLAPGDLFFALRGPNHDGNAYIDAAFEKGAVAVVGQAQSLRRAPSPPILVVPDSLAALQNLAAWARQHWGGRIVGVTGSAGKTTVKDAIAHMLAVELPVGKTVGNFNNHVGVPLSILRLPDESRVGVLEMGMNHAGEIRALAAIAKPDIGVVTNVGYAHAEAFDSIDCVALAKRELIEGLAPWTGREACPTTAVLNADDPRVLRFREIHPGHTITFGLSDAADVRATDLAFTPQGTFFRVEGIDFYTTLAGRHGVLNLLAAMAVARAFEIPLERLRDVVATFTIGEMRGERLEHNGITIWNDCYNSNPEALRAMLEVLRSTPARRHIAVLGEMLELGHAAEFLHRQAGRCAAESGLDALIAVQGAARFMAEEAVHAGMPPHTVHFFERSQSAAAGEFVRQLVQPGDAILFKGSRGVQIERVMEKVLA